jgi:hypothetical protein
VFHEKEIEIKILIYAFFHLFSNFTGDVSQHNFFSGQQGAVEAGSSDAAEYMARTLPPGSEAVSQYSNQYSIPHRTGRQDIIRLSLLINFYFPMCDLR